jgi:hypothetical protein
MRETWRASELQFTAQPKPINRRKMMTRGKRTWEGLEAETATRPSVTVEAICSKFADCFQVRLTEVGLLRLEALALRFIFPRELVHARSIPLNSTAVAARTARSRRAELFNKFLGIPHWNTFERIRLHEAEKDAPTAIQKLMSAPIAKNGAVVGVIQISRKGATPRSAGPDFKHEDLQRLVLAASDIAYVLPLLAMPDRRVPFHRLKFWNHALGTDVAANLSQKR